MQVIRNNNYKSRVTRNHVRESFAESDDLLLLKEASPLLNLGHRYFYRRADILRYNEAKSRFITTGEPAILVAGFKSNLFCRFLA